MLTASKFCASLQGFQAPCICVWTSEPLRKGVNDIKFGRLPGLMTNFQSHKHS